MSLVAYESSDESEHEIDIDRNAYISVVNPISRVPCAPNKKRGTVKIGIPSLKEFKEEETDEIANKKPILKSGCGLFSLLPPPKHSSSLCKPGFTPYILSKKNETKSKVPKKTQKSEVLPDQSPKQSSVTFTSEVAVANHDSDNDDTHTEVQVNIINTISSAEDYFSLNESNQGDGKKKSTFSEHFESCVQSSSGMSELSVMHAVETEPSYETAPLIVNNESVQLLANTTKCNDDASCPAEFNSFMEDKEFIKLQGRRHKLEEVSIVDVSADDQLTDKNEWLMKSLSEEKDLRPHKRKNNMPTQQQKRKHQITYLAFQAKERELDLKNQWALNGRTRRETQAKYGF